MSKDIVADPWQGLRALTPARIALGRTGASLPTRALLEFDAAQAAARDAARAPFAARALMEQFQGAGWETLLVQSAATDREQYLRRPDLGRRLDARSAGLLDQAHRPQGYDLVFVVADGLSAQAPTRHALPLLQQVRTQLTDAQLGPIVVAERARVALADEIGARLGARQIAILIGERPGLSAPDSLGIYLTYAPQVGRTDAQRNFISNIRPDGLCYEWAAQRLVRLVHAARRLGCTGVALKEEGAVGLADAPRRATGPAISSPRQATDTSAP